MRVVLGVSGGVAVYKAAELVRLLQQQQCTVQVVMTRHAQEFVRPLTFAALTSEKVITEMFSGEPPAGEETSEGGEAAAAVADMLRVSAIEHIAVAQNADVLVVAPATANLLARFSQGLADDFLTTLYLATPAPVVIAPAMNVNMWQHPATQANIATLRARGVTVVEPGAGYLACGMVGSGRLAELDTIVAATLAASGSARRQEGSLGGRTVLVTAGPTREAIDPARYLSNRSSGRMGYALAEVAHARGARVILISGPTALQAPAGVELVPVTSAAEMAAAVDARFEQADIVVCAAAVADYTPLRPATQKVKKRGEPLTLELAPTRDILAECGRRKQRQLVVGFAAETGEAAAMLAAGHMKRHAKRADLIVLNDVGRSDCGFDVGHNAVTLISAHGETEIPRTTKAEIAAAVWNAIEALQSTRVPITH